MKKRQGYNTGAARAAWSRQEFADRMGLGLSTLDKLMAAGVLPYRKAGGRVLITTDDEQVFLDRTKPSPTTAA